MMKKKIMPAVIAVAGFIIAGGCSHPANSQTADAAEKSEIQTAETAKPEFEKQTDKVVVPLNDSRNIEDVLKEKFTVKNPDEVQLTFELNGFDPAQVKEYQAKAVAQSKDQKTEKTFVISVEASAQTSDETAAEETESAETSEEASVQESVSADGITYIKGIPIVNKKYGVPASYAPGEDPEAVSHLMQLIQDMSAQGYSLSGGYSGFRSYATQDGLYSSYAASSGQAQADTFSARPGYSEHQTGLAFDLLDGAGQLVEDPQASQWLMDNCAQYGFIVRYQPGKESITGYMPEPWHLRYIGEQAQDIMNSGMCLEEYLGAEGGDYR